MSGVREPIAAIDPSDIGILIGVVGLVFAFTENRRARRAESRERRAEERAERSERREEERHARELEESAARRKADLVLRTNRVRNRETEILSHVMARNLGPATARDVEVWLVNEDGLPRSSI